MTQGIIRGAKPEDLEAILSLLYQLSPKKEEDGHPIREILDQICKDPEYHLIVYEEVGSVLGTAMLLVQKNLSHNAKPIGHIGNVVTGNPVRGRGIGERLTTYLIETARKSGCYKVILDCSEANSGFYERCGFRRTGEIEMRVVF